MGSPAERDLVPTTSTLRRGAPAPGLRVAAARLTWHALHAWRDPGWSECLRRYARISALGGEAFRAWQRRAVERHVRWATSRVPWFRERARGASRLEDLPVLTRRDLQREPERLLDERRAPADLQADASGGSTGQVVRVWRETSYWRGVLATEVLVLRGWGLEPWCRTAYVWGSDRDLAGMPRLERLTQALLGRRALNAFDMGKADVEGFLDDLVRFRPECVQGYASALHLVARHVLARSPRPRLRVRAVRSSAEVLSPGARSDVRAAFGGPVYDFYGSRESASLAAQCRAGRLHVLAHGRVVEVVDERGRAVPPGTPGRVLVTDLGNRAFALVRYEIGDVASFAPDAPCPCGLPYPVLERIHGRTSDFVTTPAGERIHGEWFTHLFYGRAGVESFQVRQAAQDALEVWTVGDVPAKVEADLLGQIRARLGPGVRVSWRRVDAIPPPPSGKRRFVLSAVDPWGGGA